MIFYSKGEQGGLVRLTGSTSNAVRPNGGTPYYRVASAGGVSFLCRDLDEQIPLELTRIQVDPGFIPLIRSSYTHDLAQKLGHLRPDERLQIESALKAVDEEEARMARLFASGKITDAVWDNLWAEWQDRRQKLRQSLETVQQEQNYHINNLDTALGIIAKIGVLYNSLERDDQKELLRQVVERVIVNAEGTIKLELRTPFAYLKDLTDEIRIVSQHEGVRPQMKIDRDISVDFHPECSNWLQMSWEERTLSEQSVLDGTHFLQQIAFPQRAQLARLSIS